MPARFDGETISDTEQRAVVLISASDELTVTWSRYGPGERGPSPHIHREHTDAFYVLTREITFEVGPYGDQVRAPVGSFVAVAPNVVHTFVNLSGAQATWLNFHAPDKGFAAYLRGGRDGRDLPWDSFDPPDDGGRPASEVTFRRQL